MNANGHTTETMQAPQQSYRVDICGREGWVWTIEIQAGAPVDAVVQALELCWSESFIEVYLGDGVFSWEIDPDEAKVYLNEELVTLEEDEHGSQRLFMMQRQEITANVPPPASVFSEDPLSH